MARKTRQRISYVLPLPNATAGHRLGVNGLAVDQDRSILYSGGRDGVIYAWNLRLNVSASRNPYGAALSKTYYRQHTQAHTHWINDVVLAYDDTALVSASSDISVKVWRLFAEDPSPPQTIGIHDDYVKCLASPSRRASWIAAGGLDRKICLWDLNGRGKTLELDVADDESASKGSVYALAANEFMIASGGPENVIKVWDPRSGKRITRFVGHTDNIRSILISQDGGTILTASSDQTIKVWSTVAGRCQSTLSMHNDSVWSLYSDHPQLSVFYSGDRSGCVAKTDVRGAAEWEDGLSVAVCQEQGGINKLACARNFIWTATSSSSINRWADLDTAQVVQGAPMRWGTSSHAKTGAPPQKAESLPSATAERKIALSSVLRLSPSAVFPPIQLRDTERPNGNQQQSLRKGSAAFVQPENNTFIPLRNLPEETIEGQNGLIKHVLLNDRRRVLTLDTAGEVLMWDLLQCIPIQSFGNRSIDDIVPEVNMIDNTAPWCNVDTRTGNLTCVLEENHCFDAEVYADELPEAEFLDFKEDQRINLGKWVLRYLFASLLDEEIRRDEGVRREVTEKAQHRQNRRPNHPPMSIQMPHVTFHEEDYNGTVTTPRAPRGKLPFLFTPSLSIGLATPGAALSSPTASSTGPVSVGLDGSHFDRTTPVANPARTPVEKSGDYFSLRPIAPATDTPGVGKALPTPSEVDDEGTLSPSELDRNGLTKPSAASLGKRLRISFTAKKLGRGPTTEPAKPPPVEEKAEDSDSRSSKTEEKIFDDSFLGTLQRIRHEYEQADVAGEPLTSLITPSPPQETPLLKPPSSTTIIIQEDRPDVAGVSDLFEGSLSSLGEQADLIAKVAPIWLGDVLLRNRIPLKDVVKVSFILEPYEKLLPPVTNNDGTERLNANRMLRVRKILAYVAERLEGPDERNKAMRPEEYLELYCQNQLVSPKMTLATVRTHMWRGGGDVILAYKSNGRKELLSKPEPGSELKTIGIGRASREMEPQTDQSSD